MPSINLAQSAYQDEARRRENRSRRGTFLAASFLVMVFGIWGGLVWYERVLDGDIAEIGRDVERAQEGISDVELSRIADFHFRLQAIGEVLEEVGGPGASLGMVETNIDPGVVLSSIGFDRKEREVRLEGIAGEFPVMVRQLVALKGQADIADVSLQDLKREEDGRFGFSLVVDLAEEK